MTPGHPHNLVGSLIRATGLEQAGRINNQKREMMIRYFSERGDTVMVGALLVYKTGSKFTEQELDELGRLFLTRQQPAMALAPSR